MNYKVTLTGVMSALVLLVFSATSVAQTSITIDGDMSEWTEDMRVDVPPNNPIISWEDGGGERYQPADPDDLDYLRDLSFGGLYAADDEDYLYVRIDMDEQADVRNTLTDTVPDGMYENAALQLRFSVDPNPFEDFQDTTGLTYGWYGNGYDFYAQFWPLNEDFEDTTGYNVVIHEHSHETESWGFSQYSRDLELGAKAAWNDDYNSVEIAIPKSILLQPQNFEPQIDTDMAVALMLVSQAYNHRTDDQWWSQDVSNSPSHDGFIYNYEAEWSGEDPSEDDEEPTNVSEPGSDVPNRLELYQNYPNPFNPTTQIRFAVPENKHVTVEVFDLLGRHVETLMSSQISAGQHAVTFDANNLSSGMYLYTVTAGSHTVTGKMMLVK